MKVISIYELLGLIKEGKAPKKVKYDGTSFFYSDNNYYTADSMRELFYQVYDKLNDEVEVLEEDKEITKWGKGALEEIQTKKDYKINDLQKYIELLMITQNQIIDRLNELKKGK